jgi:hypothetical protein
MPRPRPRTQARTTPAPRRRSYERRADAITPIEYSGLQQAFDHPRLLAQLCGLERKTARSGRDSIDHGPGQHDDLANAAALLGGAVHARLAG